MSKNKQTDQTDEAKFDEQAAKEQAAKEQAAKEQLVRLTEPLNNGELTADIGKIIRSLILDMPIVVEEMAGRTDDLGNLLNTFVAYSIHLADAMGWENFDTWYQRMQSESKVGTPDHKVRRASGIITDIKK